MGKAYRFDSTPALICLVSYVSCLRARTESSSFHCRRSAPLLFLHVPTPFIPPHHFVPTLTSRPSPPIVQDRAHFYSPESHSASFG
ncbi:hypothetical protein FA13DRAFT_1741745 [Coprinellus micaceus]|uniref:Uncharacterized protein n=1 Tax=Coprinellus micaceus TaxID=71717 RepID=A0A4Y7SID0_COPMI|nr:hypothetical protein FA13DRAFT_1741745 [Coprinellus micaceus]